MRTTGADALARRLAGAGRDLEQIRLTDEARALARSAGAEAPIGATGLLAAAATADYEATRPLQARVGPGRRRYAAPVHQGVPSRRQAPDPYLHRAARRHRARVTRSVNAKVRGRLRRWRLL